MKILLVSATEFEILPFMGQTSWPDINILLTGVGQMQTSFHTGVALQKDKFDLIINAGICGSFRPDWAPGKVVNVVSEQFGDLGVEESDGSFTDMFKLGFMEKDSFPFTGGTMLNNDALGFGFLEEAHGLTVNKVHGSQPSIDRMQQQYRADVETMEGAGFFYACLMHRVRFLQIRSVSNFVESRNRENWKIELALDNLHGVLNQILTSLH